MGGDNDTVVTEPCAVDCKQPGHKEKVEGDKDELGRPVTSTETLPRSPGDPVTYLPPADDGAPVDLNSAPGDGCCATGEIKSPAVDTKTASGD